MLLSTVSFKTSALMAVQGKQKIDYVTKILLIFWAGNRDQCPTRLANQNAGFACWLPLLSQPCCKSCQVTLAGENVCLWFLPIQCNIATRDKLPLSARKSRAQDWMERMHNTAILIPGLIHSAHLVKGRKLNVWEPCKHQNLTFPAVSTHAWELFHAVVELY